MLLPTNKEVMWMNNFIYKSRVLWIKSKMRESPKTKNAPQLSERHFLEVTSVRMMRDMLKHYDTTSTYLIN